jgi:hypothetical protein
MLEKIINYIEEIFMPKMRLLQSRGVSAQTLDGVIKRKYVCSLAVLDVKAQVHVNEVCELHSQVVSGHFVHQDAAFLCVTRTQANKNGIVRFCNTATKNRFVWGHVYLIAYQIMMVSSLDNWSSSIITD